jgi:hypothetical protein
METICSLHIVQEELHGVIKIPVVEALFGLKALHIKIGA